MSIIYKFFYNSGFTQYMQSEFNIQLCSHWINVSFSINESKAGYLEASFSSWKICLKIFRYKLFKIQNLDSDL